MVKIPDDNPLSADTERYVIEVVLRERKEAEIIYEYVNDIMNAVESTGTLSIHKVSPAMADPEIERPKQTIAAAKPDGGAANRNRAPGRDRTGVRG